MGGPKTPGNFVQDGPPKGGYPTVNVRRNLPGGGMSSLALFGTCCATFCYGMYTIIQANRTRRSVTNSTQDQQGGSGKAASPALSLRCHLCRGCSVCCGLLLRLPGLGSPVSSQSVISHPTSPRLCLGAAIGRAISTEDRDIRMSIVPFLQTEADVQSAFVQEKLKENEAEFMKDVPGWVAGEGVYKTRYMAPMSVYGINHGR